MIDLTSTAARIASARREKGFTQQELSQRVGVTVQAVSKWERAQSLPDADLLLDLARILGISLEYLLDGTANLQPVQRATLYDGAAADFLGAIQNHPILVLLGYELCKNLLPDPMQKLVAGVAALRRKIYLETGILLPAIRIRDEGGDVAETQCRIVLRGNAVWGETFPEPYPDIPSAILSALETSIRAQLPVFVNRHMVKLLVEHLRDELPFAVEGVIPDRVSLSLLTRVVRSLAGHNVSCYDLLAVIEALDEAHDSRANEETVIQKLIGNT